MNASARRSDRVREGASRTGASLIDQLPARHFPRCKNVPTAKARSGHPCTTCRSAYAFVGSHAARSKFGLFSSVCGTGNATWLP